MMGRELDEIDVSGTPPSGGGLFTPGGAHGVVSGPRARNGRIFPNDYASCKQRPWAGGLVARPSFRVASEI